jgi:hypothetical protein
VLEGYPVIVTMSGFVALTKVEHTGEEKHEDRLTFTGSPEEEE